MIAKEKTSPVPKDPRNLAGHEAEKQMAFYLRRAFGDDPDVLVFNDLRLVRNEEVAQIDHLVLHRFGFAIVESKSVVGELIVNQHGEFTRIDGKARKGIPSPILQGKRQGELLNKLLNDHKEQLRRKVFFGKVQTEFQDTRFRVFAAISDTGQITRENCDPEELCKADAVPDRIKQAIASQQESMISGVSGFMKYMVAGPKKSQQMLDAHLMPFPENEMNAVREFLIAQHTPLRPEPAGKMTTAEVVPPPPVPEKLRTVRMPEPTRPPTGPTPPPRRKPTAPAAEQASPPVATPALNAGRCKQCSGGNLKIVHGRYGYYYKCQDCDGNTPIDLTCIHCGGKARVTKSKLEFSRDCASCGEKVLFHVNTME